MTTLLPSFSGITQPGDHLTDHESIADTIHRLVESADSRDAAMFESCVYDYTEWDVSGLTFLKKDYGVLRGIQEMLHWQMTGPGPLFTTHMVNNVRSHMAILEDGTKTATCTAYVLAQHLPQDTPHSRVLSWDRDLFLVANRFTGELKWDGERWRFTRFALRTMWSVGDDSFIVAGRPK